MARYAIVTTEPQAGFDNAGNPVTLPAGTVVNVAEWDGVTPWNPGEGLDAVADADAVAMIGGSYGGGVFGPIPRESYSANSIASSKRRSSANLSSP